MVHVFVPVDDIDSIAPTKFYKVVGSIAWVTLAINFHVCMKIWYYLKINPMFLLRILLEFISSYKHVFSIWFNYLKIETSNHYYFHNV